MACDAIEHHRGFDRSGSQIRCAGEPGQTCFFEGAPQSVVEFLRHAALAESRLEGPPPEFVDQRTQLGGVVLLAGGVEDATRKRAHRNPIPRATTPRSTSLAPPRSVNIGLCQKAVA